MFAVGCGDMMAGVEMRLRQVEAGLLAFIPGGGVHGGIPSFLGSGAVGGLRLVSYHNVYFCKFI